MHIPLIPTDNKSSSKAFVQILAAFCLTGFALICVFFSFSFTKRIETPVGPKNPDVLVKRERPDWNNLIKPYLGFYSFVDTKQNGSPYRGSAASPIVDGSNCDTNPRHFCGAVCEDVLKDPSFLQPPFCIYTKPDTAERLCWDTSKMSCWNENGGGTVWDGTSTWTVQKHWSGHPEIEEPKHTWLHMSSDAFDVIFFTWGYKRPYEEVMKEVNAYGTLHAQVKGINAEKKILIAGHSEGSVWAVCLNEWMIANKIPNPRRVIISGSIPPTYDFSATLTRESRDNMLSLVASEKAEDENLKKQIGGEIYADVFPMLKDEPGENSVEIKSWPSFGFTCIPGQGINPKPTCLPQTTPDYGETIMAYRNSDEQWLFEIVVQGVHQWSTYKSCLKACIPEFQKTDNFNFDENLSVELFPYNPAKPSLVRSSRKVVAMQKYNKKKEAEAKAKKGKRAELN